MWQQRAAKEREEKKAAKEREQGPTWPTPRTQHSRANIFVVDDQEQLDKVESIRNQLLEVRHVLQIPLAQRDVLRHLA